MAIPEDARAARRSRRFRSARDFETSSSQIGDVDPFDEAVLGKARLLVCGNARGRSRAAKVADADELMRMLGIHPSQEPLQPPLTALAANRPRIRGGG